MSPAQLAIEHHGAALYPGAALSIRSDLEAALSALPADRAAGLDGFVPDRQKAIRPPACARTGRSWR